LGSLLGVAEVAEAQTAPSRVGPVVVALDYSAPSGCPNEARFRERVERTGARLRWEAPGEAARAYRVHIEDRGAAFEGQLYETGKTEPRVLDGPVCEELVDALSLMLALSADAVAESAVPPTTPKLRPAAPTSTPSITLEKPAHPLARAQHVFKPHLLGLSALALLNAAPDALGGPALSYERALKSVFSLRLEARVALGGLRAYETYGGVAPAVCLRLEGSLAQLVGCGGLVFGYLDVKGAEYSGGKQSEYCLAPLLGLKLRAFIVGDFSLELGAELEHAFIKRSYTLKRDDSTFETPIVSEVFQFGAGVRL